MKPRIAILILATAAVGLAASVAAEAVQPGRKYAVVVGINTYESPDVNSLRYAVRDARALADTLRAAGYKVFELTDDRRDSENYPKRTNVVFRLGWVRDHLRPEDSLVFYFSGHGMEVDGRTFLLTKESDPRTIDTLKESACRSDDVNEILAKVKARRILAVYDACRSNPRADKGGGANLLSHNAARDLVLGKAHGGGAAHFDDRIRATFFACSPGQRSYEWNAKRHGFFTFYLIQGLKGEAGGGRVTLDGLFTYVRTKVHQSADEEGDQQTPYEIAEGTGLDGWVISPGHLQVVDVPAAPEPEAAAPAPARPEPQAEPARSDDETPAPEPAPAPAPVHHDKPVHKAAHHGGGSVDPSIVGHWETYAGAPIQMYLYANGTFQQEVTPASTPATVYRGRFAASGGHYYFTYTYAAERFGAQTHLALPSREAGQYVLRGGNLYSRALTGPSAGQIIQWTPVPSD